MKKLAILLATLISLGASFTAFADETTRPSISISDPSLRFVNTSSDIRFTISLASAHDEGIVFNPSLIKAEGFNFEHIDAIRINENTYDVIFRGISSTDKSKIGRIICLKGTGTLNNGLLTYESPKSSSFFIFDEMTSRKEIAEYLMRFLPENEREYIYLSASGLMIGDGQGNLELEQHITTEQAYILNRRLELIK